MAWPITWPPNTRCQLVFGLLPRNRFTSIGSMSRMASRSIRLLDMSFLRLAPSFRGARERERTRNPEVAARDSGFTSKSAVADLDIIDPNSGKPEVGGVP